MFDHRDDLRLKCVLGLVKHHFYRLDPIEVSRESLCFLQRAYSSMVGVSSACLVLMLICIGFLQVESGLASDFGSIR